MLQHLTTGVIARNGLPQLQKCLEGLTAIVRRWPEVEVVLVDSASRDETLQVMTEWARQHHRTRVFSLKGRTNASVARNVIIDHAAPGVLWLLDGDIEPDPRFLAAALEELEGGAADAVYGQLPETNCDSSGRQIRDTGDRYRVRRRSYVHLTFGTAVFGPGPLLSGIRFDEEQRCAEDLEFGLRVGERWRILALPIPMGRHYTVPYLSPDRIGDFYRRAYLRPLGRLLRRSLAHPRRFWHLRSSLQGVLVGGLLVVGWLGSALAGSAPALMVMGAVTALDVVRFAAQRRLSEYPHRRLGAPIQIVLGMLWPESDTPTYAVSLAYDSAVADDARRAVGPDAQPLVSGGSRRSTAPVSASDGLAR